MRKKSEGLAKIYRYLILCLPAALYFSYYPIISFGANETMNFELSVPLIWLVLFDALAIVLLIKEKKIKMNALKWPLMLFPIFATLSVLWSGNAVRGILTVMIMWLIVLAGFSFWAMRDLVNGEGFRYEFLKWFFGASLAACFWCVLQCVLDTFGVGREYTLLCPGCTAYSFGFPHPNGLAIEPQFMGNLLLAPTIVSGWLILRKLISKNLELERSRGDSFYNGSVGARTKFQFRDSLRDRCKNHAGSRSLCSQLLLISFFIFSATLFLTFSRGAIYAFIVAMIFMTTMIVSRSKCFTRDRKLGRTALSVSRVKHFRAIGALWLMIIFAFLFTLNLQGVLAQIGPTNDMYQSGVAKALNHLSLGIIDIRQQKSEENVNDDVGEINEGEEMDSAFDGYVVESTEIRKMMTRHALKVWSQDVRTMLFGVGIGGAGQAMFDAGLIDSPKEIVQNEYASLLLEVGIVGVILLALAAVLIIKLVIKSSAAPMVLTLMVAYGVTLVFFSGFANALQIYLLPIVLGIVEDNN